jgi:8-oxo-dGTP diphosphatase
MFSYQRDRLVLIRKNHPDWQKGLMNGVGGHMEENESVWAAMSREFLEEAGVETNPLEWQHKLTIQNRVVQFGYNLHILVAFSNLAYKVDSKTSELISLAHVDQILNDPGARSQLIPNLNWIIPFLLDPNIRPGVIIEDIGRY